MFRYTKGKGPGGQHKNKTSSCVVARHVPTGIEVTVDGRNQHANKREAIKRIEQRLAEESRLRAAEVRSQRRDAAIRDNRRVRTYDFTRAKVTDHRTGKTASIKDILVKGQLEKLR